MEGNVIEIEAPYWRRFASLIVDFIILDFTSYVFFRKYLPKSFTYSINTKMYLAIVAISLITLFYFVYQEKTYKKTLGQRIFGLKIEEKHAHGNIWIRHIINNLFVIFIFPFSLLWFIEPIYILIKGKRLLESLSGIRTIYAVRIK